MFHLNKSRIVAGIMMLCTTGLAFPAFAQDEIAAVTAAEQINSANELVRQGKFDNAIEQYQRVTVSASDRDELNYNQAVAQYRKGDLETAEALFTDAACSNDSSIAASSRYNLGNCWYAKGLQNVEQDKPMAIEQLRQAIDHFRGSLRGNPDNPDARPNIELAVELIRKLQEEQQQEEQEQEEQDQQQDQQEQDKQQQQENQQSQSENADSQKSDSEESDSEPSEDSQSKGSENQPQPDPSSESTSDDQPSQQQSEQSDSEQENQSDPDESEPSKAENEQSQNEEAGSQDQQNADQQNAEQTTEPRQSRQGSQGDQPQDNEPQPADQQPGDENDDETEQQVPTGELTSAEQNENEKPNGSVAMADPNAKDGLMTKEEALKMLQAVRDSDMLRRLKRQQQERSRHVPVDRDW